mgnify:FL=1|jgi:hypothetical protein|tara:strand:- start:4637 stop:4867 length:231 start_codon:yes stop_codon:yes gene_type:complete
MDKKDDKKIMGSIINFPQNGVCKVHFYNKDGLKLPKGHKLELTGFICVNRPGMIKFAIAEAVSMSPKDVKNKKRSA